MAAGAEIFGQSRGTMPGADRQNFAHAREQLLHFQGWVFACVHALASRIAGQAVHVGVAREGLTADGPQGAREIPGHPLAMLLRDPNDLQTAWALWYFVVSSLELTGKSLLWCIEVKKRKQLLPIPSSWIAGMNGSTSFESFTIRPPTTSEEYIIPADEACYFFYPHPSDPKACASPLQAAAYAVSCDEQIQRSQLAMFERGIHPSHAIIIGKHAGPDGSVALGVRPSLTGQQRRQLVDAVHKLYSGAVKNHEPIVLDGLVDDIKRLSSTSAEMDWQNSGAITKARISQILGVNPIILGEIESANRASSLAAEEHLASTINPKLRLLGDTMTEWLGPQHPVNGGRVVVWFDKYQPRDAEMELRKWQLAIQAGAVSPDEIREQLLGLKPLMGGLGMLPAQPPDTIEEAIDRSVQVQVMATLGHYRALGGFDPPKNGKPRREVADV